MSFSFVWNVTYIYYEILRSQTSSKIYFHTFSHHLGKYWLYTKFPPDIQFSSQDKLKYLESVPQQLRALLALAEV